MDPKLLNGIQAHISWELIHSPYINNNRIGRLYYFSCPWRYCEHCHKREVQ